jgi:hypothetical protein
MSRMLTTAIIWLSALYAAVAVLVFTLFLGPFTGISQLPAAIVCVVLVVLPYALLHASMRMANTSSAQTLVTAAAIICAAIGVFLYWGSFRHNDGEYVIAYVLTPVAQSPFAVGALAFAYRQWRRRAT